MTTQTGVTRKRLAGAAVFFVVATILLALAGIDLTGYLSGAVAGIAIVGIIAWLTTRRRRTPGDG